MLGRPAAWAVVALTVALTLGHLRTGQALQIQVPELNDSGAVLFQTFVDASTGSSPSVNSSRRSLNNSTVEAEDKTFVQQMAELGSEVRRTALDVAAETVPVLSKTWPDDFLTDDQEEEARGQGIYTPVAPASEEHVADDPLHRTEGAINSMTSPHHHSYLALAFLLGALGFGSLLQMAQERFLQQVPYTCLLFVLGWILGLIHYARKREHWDSEPTWFISVEFWEHIDPHLVFYVFLPVLIFAEAMRLNVKLASKCLGQVMLLACPGVCIGAFLIAAFAKYGFPYGWSWPTALVFGSILSATDPVAVVALFQTLGVPARLTMIISGESLLNDGTAIVLFELMLRIMLGGTIGVGFTVLFFIRMAVVSILLGVALACAGLIVISWCAESNYHTDAMIQVIVSVTISVLCFFLAENEFSTSGVLTVVSSGCVFSYVAWPRFVSKETIRTVWEAIEFMGNTIIFLLAGLLFSSTCLSRSGYLRWSDIGWLLVLYIVVTLIRMVMVLLLWPFMNMCGQKITWQEALVIVWSGLRGAVGLILAIIVDTEPAIAKQVGSRMIFHVGGIAMLTIMVNSIMSAPLLRKLELTKAPEVEEQSLEHLARLTDERSWAALDNIIKSDDPRFKGADKGVVEAMVPKLAHHFELPEGKKRDSDVASKLRLCREIWMRSVARHYWTSIEEGMIPKNSRIARIILYSTDEALTNSKQSLCDWDYVSESLGNPSGLTTRVCHIWPFRMSATLLQWFPTASIMDMWKVYAALACVEAHQAAETQVAKHFAGESVVTGRVQEQVGRESALQREKALAVLKTVPSETIELAKSKMLAGKLLQLQLKTVGTLEEDGLLEHRGASTIIHHIHTVQREMVAGAFTGMD